MEIDGGILNWINEYNITSFKFCADDQNNRIIIMGKCFFQIWLNRDLLSVKKIH